MDRRELFTSYNCLLLEVHFCHRTVILREKFYNHEGCNPRNFVDTFVGESGNNNGECGDEHDELEVIMANLEMFIVNLEMTMASRWI